MLHAPTSETKNETTKSKAPAAPQPTWDLDTSLLKASELRPAMDIGSGFSLRVPAAQHQRRLAEVQATYGNQAVLRMLNGARAPTSPQAGGLLQRKCACDSAAGLSGTCAECAQKRGALLQRAPASPGSLNAVPSMVHEVLRSPGQLLDAATREFMEPRSGYDFSQVRVHTDAKAAESARAVNALAYTVGRDVVFGVRQYSPDTSRGRKLIAHELAHTIQRSSHAGGIQGTGALTATDPGNTSEREAEAFATAVIRSERVTQTRLAGPGPALNSGKLLQKIELSSRALLQRQEDDSESQPAYEKPVTPAPAPPITPPSPLPPGFKPQAWICGRPLRYPGLNILFGHAFVAAPPDNYAIIAPLCTPTDGGSDSFITGTAAQKWDNSPDPCDDDPECVVCQPKTGVKDVKKCLRDAFDKYNSPTLHKATGPNSNTFAGTLARTCCDGMSNATPFLSTLIYPGWGDPPAPSRPAKCPSGPPQCT